MIFIPFSSFSTYPGNYCNLEKYDIFLHLVPFHHSFLLTNKLQTGYFSQSQHHTTEVTGSHNRTDVNGEKKKERERFYWINETLHFEYQILLVKLQVFLGLLDIASSIYQYQYMTA